ncbi:MAG: PEP-CTERM sorting domain-containing protein [Planctomycetes bacterium]|nr:PEP-CTERM sorting domain-containing protein [Planctomycetota bacterium]
MSRTTVILSVAFMAVLAWLVPADAHAAPISVGTVIGVDIGNTNGSVSNYNLLDSIPDTIAAGSVIDTSSVTVDNLSLNLTATGSGGWAGGAGSTAPSFPDANVRNDFRWAGGTGAGIALTISGLDNSLYYNWVSTSSHTSTGRNNRMTLTGLVGGLQSQDSARTPTSEHRFYAIQPTAGTITATVTETLANNPIFNGVKLTAVDAPKPIGVGTVIGVDFGTVNGGGVNYNLFPGNGAIAAGSVIDTSGVVVQGASLTLTGGQFFNGNGPSTAPSFPDEVRRDFTGASGGNGVVFTLSGLDPNYLYDWVSTSSHGTGTRINRVTLSGLVGGDQFLDDPRSPTSEHNFTGIQPTAAGVITATVTDIGAGNPILNGVQLVATEAVVPEPSSFVLAGLGLLSLVVFGRRRRRLK